MKRPLSQDLGTLLLLVAPRIRGVTGNRAIREVERLDEGRQSEGRRSLDAEGSSDRRPRLRNPGKNSVPELICSSSIRKWSSYLFDPSPIQKSHPFLQPGALDTELGKLPPPPADLPKPWDGAQWRRLFFVSLIAFAFVLWFAGRLFEIPILSDFANACTFSASAFLVIGLLLVNRFGMRGFYVNYAASTNKPLNKAMRRYKRHGMSEAWYQLFLQYMIDGEKYYLVWYVPNTGPALTRALKAGSEPLLFDAQGRWLDDEVIFNKVFMMWYYAKEFSPGNLRDRRIGEYNTFRKLILRHIPPLPRRLRENESTFIQRGVQVELELVGEAFPARSAFLRNSLEILLSKIAWAKAHGGDSLTQLRYQDILDYHDANIRATESRRAFREVYRLDEAEEAALTMSKVLMEKGASSKEWMHRDTLDDSFQAFSAPIPLGPDPYFVKKDGRWLPPDNILEVYRSRVAYAHEVDAKSGVGGKSRT